MGTLEGRAKECAPKSGSVLGFDFGERRIGVAVGDWSLRLAHPLATVQAEGQDGRFRMLATLIEQWQPVQLVVGLPLHMDGSPHGLTEACRKFARQLEGRFHLPVALVDERLSSREADIDLREAGRGGKRGKEFRDQAAARIILQSYFDEHGHLA